MYTRRKALNLFVYAVPTVLTSNLFLKPQMPRGLRTSLPLVIKNHLSEFSSEMETNLAHLEVESGYCRDFFCCVEDAVHSIDGAYYKYSFKNKLGNEIWLIHDQKGQRTIMG